MLFLILSILCSVIVGVIFKISRKYNANPSQIISFNYIAAIALLITSLQLRSVTLLLHQI
ncbi:hypothetical protein D3C86_346460 [compost metagenome]